MKKIFVVLVIMSACVAGLGCDSETADGGTPSEGLSFITTADFASSAVASISKGLVKATTSGECTILNGPPYDMDDPRLTEGRDCDEDGGRVAHLTPTKYDLALKSATLKSADPDVTPDLILIADAGTLADSEVVNFTEADTSESVVTLEPGDLHAGEYTGIEVEIYYFQMTFPVAGVEQNVRIYMSDDDFEAEGSLGHHQGDITFIDDDGNELGWINSTWLEGNLLSTRANTADAPQNGAGEIDRETNHYRGFFGNEDLWNASDMVQGSDQDIYIFTVGFDEPLIIPDPAVITDLTTVTLTFSVADAFYYEDFTPFNNSTEFPGFYPGADAGGEAASDGHEWAPQAPTAVITYN